MTDRLLGGLVLAALFLVGVGFAIPSTATDDPDFRPLGAPSNPVRLVVPALDLRADVVPISLPESGTLDPPEDATLVGWWDESFMPGSEGGQTVLTGHTLHDGGGVMDRLGDVEEGQRVAVVTDAGRVAYDVDSVETLSTAELTERNVEIFAQDRDDNRLVLITCTGWDGQEFTENIVVYATQLGVPVQQRA